MAKIFIDDQEFEVDGSKNLLEVCLSLGYNLTYFCWHPALHSVGACRQCAVIQYKDENDKKGKLVMACMQPAADNTRISLTNDQAILFRAENIESLMINHPHDCPVCDEGGECHLQDMTLMSGHNYRRYRFTKRTHLNQYLGPFINHEMNRCIQCYRCVRYYKDFAGGHDLNVFASRDNVYFGRTEPGTLENEFSGNLVEVCPTGVFTDKTLKQHYTRKWDLTNAPSVCHGCSVGCNTIASERYGGLRRILSRYHHEVNGYFLCDRGRFGYEYVNSPKRILYARKGAADVPVLEVLREIKDVLDGATVVGIGSPRASLESNFMLKKLVGDDFFCNGISRTEGKPVEAAFDILQNGKVKTPSLSEMAECDAVFVLGEDVTNTAPMMALAIRQAAKVAPARAAEKLKIPYWNDAAIRTLVQDQKGPVFTAGTHATKLDEIATESVYLRPEELIELSGEILNAVENHQPERPSTNFSEKMVDAMLKAEKPLIVSGTSLQDERMVKAAANIAYALADAGKEVRLAFAVPEVNSMGMPFLTKRYLEDAFTGTKGTVAIILENDLYYRASNDAVDRFLSEFNHVIVLDSLENDTTAKAHFTLPAGTFAESDGTVVNQEGRAQRFYQVYMPQNDVRSSWSWLNGISDAGPVDFSMRFDDVVEAMGNGVEELKVIKDLAPDASFRIGTQKIPRSPHRFSGRTAMNANRTIHEPTPPADVDSPLSFTMEGYHGVPPSADIPFYWAPGWNSAQAINKYQKEVGGVLKGGTPGIRLLHASGAKNERFDLSGSDGVDIIPIYHIFGSEELSAQSPAIAERAPELYVMLNEADVPANHGLIAEVHIEGAVFRAAIVINHTIPKGMIGFPKGLRQATGIAFHIKDWKIRFAE